jgi:hypothetical protein
MSSNYPNHLSNNRSEMLLDNYFTKENSIKRNVGGIHRANSTRERAESSHLNIQEKETFGNIK